MGWPGGSWEATLTIGAAIAAVYSIVVYLSTLVWTYRDIRARTRDGASQVAAVVLTGVFFLAGLVVYLILRPKETLSQAYERSLEEEALLAELQDQPSCPGCRRAVADDYLVCPHCAAQLREPCAACARPLSNSWVACPYCGVRRQNRPSRTPGQPGRGEPSTAHGSRFSALTDELDAALMPPALDERGQPLELPRRPAGLG